MKLTLKAGKLKSPMTGRALNRILAFVLVISIMTSLGALASAATFSDVPSSHWAYSAIKYVSTNKYMVGTGNNLFSPNGTLTKGQIIATLYRVAEEPETPLYQPYSDVAQGHYYYKAVCWAYRNSLSQVIQKSPSTFSPGSAITRVKMAELIWKFAKVNGWTSNVVPSVSLPYSDIAGLTTTQKNALKWCYGNSIMVGVSGTAFSPYSTITRAQAAMIVYKFDGFIARNSAFCVGTKYNDTYNIDTTIDATNARDSYKKLGYNVTCVTAPTVGKMRNKHSIKSKILFFSGHADSGHMAFRYMQHGDEYKTGVYYANDFDSLTGYKYVGIAGNMDFVSLAVFAGCNTATGDDNIAKRARDYGAHISIGWRGKVFSGSHSNWLSRFNSILGEGGSLASAMAYADSFIYLPFSNVKNYAICSDSLSLDIFRGDSVSDVNRTTSAFNNTSEKIQAPNNLLESFEGNTTIDGEDISAEVAEIIQQFDNNFNINDYKVYVYKNSDEITTIDFIRVIGGFETSSGYTAKINGNHLTSLYNNSKNISEDNIASATRLSKRLGISLPSDSEEVIVAQNANAEQTQTEPKELTEALRLAFEQTQSSPQKEAAQQTYHYYYDVENETACILVYTDYYFDGTDAMGVDLYTYNLVD